MKNFTNNFKQFTSRLSARWLIMALMLLLGTGSAWAGMWINDNNGWNIEIERNGTSTWIGGTYGFNREDKNGAYKDYSAENTTSLKIKNAWVKASSNDNWQIRYAAIYCRVSTNQSGNFSQIKCKDYGSNKSNANSIEFQINDIAYDVVNGLAPGTYYLDYYFSVGNDGCDKGYCYAPEYNCNGTNPYCSNCQNCNYYSIKFKVPEQEKKYSLGGYIQVGNAMADKSTYYSTYDLAKQTDGTYKGTFSFSKSHNNAQYIYIVDNAGTIYGPQTNDYPMSPGDETTLSKGKSNKVQASIALNTEYVFTFNPTTGAFTYSLECTPPDFSVSLSKSEVAVGCTGVTASITGDDSPTITWSSSDTKVATIDSDGAINIKAAGTTTITATTTEAGGFCGGVEKTATLTVKSPSVKVSANKNSLCEDETLTLTATLTNCGTDNSIQWYKGEDLLTGETKDQLTISSVTTTNSGEYKAVVTGGIICSSIESSAVTITVNALPSAPSLSNPEAICEGTTFTLPEKDDSKKTITWVGVDNRTLTGLTAGTHKYTAKIVENGCESTTVDYTITVKEQLAKPDLDVTNVKQCGSNYTEGKIVINNYNPANTYILKKGGNPINKEYNDGYSLSENEIGTYTVEVSKDNACGATSDAKIIEVTNNTPTVNSFAITKQPNVCMGNPVTLSYDDTEQSGDITYAWYEGVSDVVLGTEATLTIQQARNASYKLVVTVTSNDCPASDEATTTVEPKAVPSAPTFDNDAMDACVNQQFTLPKPNNLKYEEVALWTVNGQPTTASQTINVAGNYTYTAYKNDGCPSQGTSFTVRVNPLPRITAISVNNSTPVINEDVLLTVEGSDIARVEWSITSGNNASLSDASGNSVKLTSTTSGTVTVTATATSGAGCTATSTKEVTFKAVEECEPTVTTHDKKTKVRVKKDNCPWNIIKIYSHGGQSSGNWPGVDMTEGTGEDAGYYVYKFESVNSNFKVIFNNGNSNGENQTVSGTATKGKVCTYTIGANSCKEDNNYRRCLEVTTSDYKTTTPAEITAPAVKTVSATSEEGSGTVTFTGQIIKTGCAATSKIYYGYQFKKADEEWPTTGVETSNTPVEGKLIPLTNASETALYYQFSANVENLEDVDYHFRAYIINGYDFTNGNYDQGVYYGLDKLVTVSTVQTPVRTATITLTDAEGKEVDKKYCVGETAYIMVESDVKYTEISWKSQQGVDIVQTRLMNMYQFVVKGNDNIVVLLSNKYNVTPAESNTKEVYTFADPILPRVSLNKVSICSNDAVGATVKLTNVVKGQTYQLYQQIDKGDGTFTEKAIGEAKTQTEEVTDKTELVLHTLNNTYTTGKYFVKTYTSDCNANIVATQPFTFTVVDAAEVFISIDPASAETTPWMPAKFTVNASDKYTLNVTKGIPAEPATEVEVNQNGNKVSVKIPLPQGSTLPEGTTGVYGQYENVVFPQGATTQYTITATLSATGGDNPCADPASATVNLVPYVEECTVGH